MATSKKRLGRGLGSLIAGGGGNGGQPASTPAPSARKADLAPKKKPGPGKNTSASGSASAGSPNASPGIGSDMPGYREIPLKAVDPNPYQPRREMAQEALQELAESIRSEGLLQPIVVRAKGERFEIIAGERRFRACGMLKLKSVPARIVEASDSTSAVVSLVENLQREGLNPIEEALGFSSLMRDFDLTQDSVSERVGKPRSSIANALRLLLLEEEIQRYLTSGQISVGHAKVLLGVEESAHRVMLARQCIEERLSVRELESRVQRQRNASPSGRGGVGGGNGRGLPEAEQAAIRDLEKRLCSNLNTRVQLKHSPKKGRIVIDYHGNDELQRILERLGLEV